MVLVGFQESTCFRGSTQGRIGHKANFVVKRDKQIPLIVLLAAVFWLAAWKHEFVRDTLHKTWKNVVGMVQHSR